MATIVDSIVSNTSASRSEMTEHAASKSTESDMTESTVSNMVNGDPTVSNIITEADIIESDPTGSDITIVDPDPAMPESAAFKSGSGSGSGSGSESGSGSDSESKSVYDEEPESVDDVFADESSDSSITAQWSVLDTGRSGSSA